LPKPVGGNGIMVAKSGVRKDNGRRETIEQGDLIWCEPKLK
jgi:hypothetical protein